VSILTRALPVGHRSGPSKSGKETGSTVTLNSSIRDLVGHAALTVSGHLRPAPDPACESALRAAFAELDAELAEILGDRAIPRSFR